MKRPVFLLCMLLFPVLPLLAQEAEDVPADSVSGGDKSLLKLQFYRSKDPVLVDGEMIYDYFMPELPVYKPMRFRSVKERRKFDKMVYNVKKVLPIAKRVNLMLTETYETLETLPDKKTKDAHIKQVEKDIKAQYTPEMKKLTFSQGKLLIKLVDRECNQQAFEIVQAFLGPARATFYQIFAWTFKASLKKNYDPNGEDAQIERICRQIETGQL